MLLRSEKREIVLGLLSILIFGGGPVLASVMFFRSDYFKAWHEAKKAAAIAASETPERKAQVQAENDARVAAEQAAKLEKERRTFTKLLSQRVLYNGDNSYTIFCLADDGITLNKYRIGLAGQDGFNGPITIKVDAEEDEPINVVFRNYQVQEFLGYERWETIEMHLHDATEIGAGGWRRTSTTGKGKRSIQHQAEVIE